MNKPWVYSALLVAAASGACSEARYSAQHHPSLSFPARFAEGSERGPGDAGVPDATPRATDAGQPEAGVKESPPPATAPSPSARKLHPSSTLPDPEPLRSSELVEFHFLYRRGEISLQSVRRLTRDKPQAAARRMGRWAVELWLGRELIERIRFNFPLLGAEPPEHDPKADLSQGLEVQARVLMPVSPRATRAVLLDRATGERIELPWPVEPGTQAGIGAAKSSD